MNNKVKKSIRVGAGFALCLMIVTTACGQQGENVEPKGEITVIENPSGLNGDSFEEMVALPEQETAVIGVETDNGSECAEAENPDEDSEETDQATGGECFPYDYYEADEPWVIAEVEEGKEYILSFLPVRGLIGYSSVSERRGGISSYKKDREVIIEENVGMGLFQSERLAVVREEIKNMFIDIIRGRGEGADGYLEYFDDPALLGLDELKSFLETELEEDWLLLQAPYLDEYAGNRDEVLWQGGFWGNDGIYHEPILQPAETESHYYFAYKFDADYRAMGYGEHDSAIYFWFICSVSKETGLIDEFRILKNYQCRYDKDLPHW